MIRRFAQIRVVLAGAALLAVAGCNKQMMTYSQDYTRKGVIYYNSHEYEAAVDALQVAIKEDPSNYKAHYFLGASYDQLGKYQEAIKSYKTSLDAMQETLAGREDTDFRERDLEGLATAVGKSADRDAEIKNFANRAATSNAPIDYIIMARIFRASGDPDSAMDMYAKGMNACPDSFMLAKEYGLFLQKMGLVQKSIAPLRRAEQLYGHDSQVNDALAAAGARSGNYIPADDITHKPGK